MKKLFSDDYTNNFSIKKENAGNNSPILLMQEIYKNKKFDMRFLPQQGSGRHCLVVAGGFESLQVLLFKPQNNINCLLKWIIV